MKVILDMHNHTLASGHAYSTLEEIAREASKKGLKYVGITDHAPKMPGAPHIFHIANQKVIPEKIEGVNILKGVEANILDSEGSLDVSNELLENLDIVIASLHEACIEPTNEKEHTEALLNVMDNPNVDILGHIGNPAFPIDKEKVVLKAKETNTLVEINNSSFISSRIGSFDYCKEIAILCRDNKVPIIMNSDSHISFDVGELEKAIEMLQSINMPNELIINYHEDMFLDFLKNRKKG